MLDVKAAYDKRQAPGDLDGDLAGHELPELDRQLSDLHRASFTAAKKAWRVNVFSAR